MSSCVGVERENPYQTMDSGLTFQVSEGIGPGDLYGHALVAALVLKRVQNLRLEVMALAPSEVHPHQHGSPVAGLRSAGSGVDGQKQVSLVVLAVEKGLELEGSELILKLQDLVIHLFCVFLVAVVLFLVQLDKIVRLVDVLDQLLEGQDRVLDGVDLSEYGISLLLVTPEVRLECLFFKFC